MSLAGYRKAYMNYVRTGSGEDLLAMQRAVTPAVAERLGEIEHAAAVEKRRRREQALLRAAIEAETARMMRRREFWRTFRFVLLGLARTVIIADVAAFLAVGMGHLYIAMNAQQAAQFAFSQQQDQQDQRALQQNLEQVERIQALGQQPQCFRPTGPGTVYVIDSRTGQPVEKVVVTSSSMGSALAFCNPADAYMFVAAGSDALP